MDVVTWSDLLQIALLVFAIISCFYNKKRYGFGRYGISFNKELYGFGPGNFINAVKLVAYNDIVMRQFDLGQIYGYDNQEIELPVKHIVKDSFSVIIGKCLKNKEFVWDSGKVISDETVNVDYAGEKLKSSTAYYWQVQSFDKDGVRHRVFESYYQTR